MLTINYKTVNASITYKQDFSSLKSFLNALKNIIKSDDITFYEVVDKNNNSLLLGKNSAFEFEKHLA